MGKQLKILVVDDDPDFVELLTLTFQRAGYDVISTNDGPSGLDAALEQQPDLITLDIMMPGMDGFQVFDSLKADQRTFNIPVVMITAKSDSPSVAKGWMEGVDAYIKKPCDLNEVIKDIKKVFAFYGKEKWVTT